MRIVWLKKRTETLAGVFFLHHEHNIAARPSAHPLAKIFRAGRWALTLAPYRCVS